MAATQNQPLYMEIGDRNEVPIDAGTAFYLGQMVFQDGNGNGSGILSSKFIGHVADPVNTIPPTKGTTVRLVGPLPYRMKVPISGVAQANLGASVYASDNNTYTLTKSNNPPVGIVVRIDSAGYAIVEFLPMVAAKLCA